MILPMEGWTRGGARFAVVACIAVGALAGCGSQEGIIHTGAPAATFAPMVALDARERWFPMSAEWFVNHSVLWWSMNLGCPDRIVAIGKRLERSSGSRTLDPRRLGRHNTYTRSDSPSDCRFVPSPRFKATQHTRPFDIKEDPLELPETEGFYLDLEDKFRVGPRPREDGSRSAVPPTVPVYADAHAEQVDGEPGMRISYWMLYGRHQPNHGFDARYWEPAHEGDWERFDVLLQHEPGSGGYTPVAVSARADGRRRQIAWDDLVLVGETHPLLDAGRWTHELVPASKECRGCIHWRTSRNVEALAKQPWYGYGGAWGDFYRTGASTGPIGPHPPWR